MARRGRNGQGATSSAEEHLGLKLAQEVAGRAGCRMDQIDCRKPGRLIFLDVPGIPRARGTTPPKVVADLRRRADNMQAASKPATG